MIRLLMLGNSYTSFNDLAQGVESQLANTWDEPTVIALTQGGQTLDGHLENAQDTGSPWNEELTTGTHDWVILQDQSQIPGFPPQQSQWVASRDGAAGLDAMAADIGAETLFFLTWGRRDGDNQNPDRYPDFTTMQEHLTSGYLKYAEACDRPVFIAPAGPAFAVIHDDIVAAGQDPTDPESLFFQLYNSDGSHPSGMGSELVAYVFYAALSGRSPVGLPSDDPNAAALQDAAHRALFDDPFGELAFPFAKEWGELDTLGGGEVRPWVRISDDQVQDVTLDDAVLWVEGSLTGTVQGEGDLIVRGSLTAIGNDAIVLDGDVTLDANLVLDAEPGVVIRADSITWNGVATANAGYAVELLDDGDDQILMVTGEAPAPGTFDSDVPPMGPPVLPCGCASGTAGAAGSLVLAGLMLMRRRR